MSTSSFAAAALDNWTGHKPNCIGGRKGPCNCGANGKVSVYQVMPPRPLNNFGDFTQLMHDTKTLPPGQSAFTLAVPYVFDMTEEFTHASLQAMKDGLRAQFELGLQVIDAAIKGEVLEEKRIIVAGN